MDCQSLFSEKNDKKIISLSSAEFVHRVVMVNWSYDTKACQNPLCYIALIQADNITCLALLLCKVVIQAISNACQDLPCYRML